MVVVVGEGCSQQICHVHGHLFDGGVVELFNVVQCTYVVLSHKVDGNALTAKTTATTNSATQGTQQSEPQQLQAFSQEKIREFL
jgi:hypothetical protein